MNYIYNIKHIHNKYMFHNKELSVNDIVWGYEPKGKLIFNGGYEDVWEQNTEGDKPNYLGQRFVDTKHEGTGKVIAKYKVVEVYDLEDSKQKIAFLMQTPDKQFNQWCEKHFWAFGDTQSKAMRSYEQFGYTNQRYAYKLEKIEDVSMELDSFYVASKYNKFLNDNFTEEELETMFALCLPKELVEYLTLTRYNGLTQVILRGEKE